MRVIIFTFLFLAACFNTSFAQDLPSKSSILKIIVDANRKMFASDIKDLGVDIDKPFKYINAKFTNFPYKECLVIVPVLFGNNTRDMVIHFNKANSNLPWTKDYLHISENAPYSYEDANTIDINPTDGLKEITYNFGTMIRGYKKNSFKIISLKSSKEKVLYSNNSFLFPGEDEYASSLSVGDTVYELNSVKIKDLDNDGVKEIEETKKIGLLLNKVQEIGGTYWDMKIEKVTYVTIYSFKNGTFIKLKPKLISSKSSSYDIDEEAVEKCLEVNVEESIIETITGIEKEMIYIKGGTFKMGSNDGEKDEKPVHTVTLNNFYIGKFEITQAQWTAIIGNNQSKFKADNWPAEQVSWNDIQEFLLKLNAKSGKNYRLPTEAEWEFAAGDYTDSISESTKFAGTNTESTLGDYAWYDDNSDITTHEVGLKKPNKHGLYDMSGNVWEWCNDMYGEYSSNSQINPTGSSTGLVRVVRGGGWNQEARSCRITRRAKSLPDNRIYFIGFRIVRSR